MLVMRLQRIGKKGQAYFRFIVTEHTKKPQGEYLELLGSYDPHQKVLKIKKERVDHWMSKGVKMSPTMNNLLINHKIIEGVKVQSWRPKVSTKNVPTPVEKPVEAKTEKPVERSSAPAEAKPEKPDEPVSEPAPEVAPEAPATV